MRGFARDPPHPETDLKTVVCLHSISLRFVEVLVSESTMESRRHFSTDVGALLQPTRAGLQCDQPFPPIVRQKRQQGCHRPYGPIARRPRAPLRIGQIGLVSLDGAAMLLSSGRRPHGEIQVGSRNPLESSRVPMSKSVSKTAADKSPGD
jgi:hypothetical protein